MSWVEKTLSFSIHPPETLYFLFWVVSSYCPKLDITIVSVAILLIGKSESPTLPKDWKSLLLGVS